MVLEGGLGDRNRYALNAWRLYRCAIPAPSGCSSSAPPRFAKIHRLVGNFGFTSATRAQRSGRKATVPEAGKRPNSRLQRAGRAGTGQRLERSELDAAAERCLHHRWRSRTARVPHRRGQFRPVRPLRRCARPVRETEHAAQDAVDLWQGYFTQHPESLWMNGAPRVLARRAHWSEDLRLSAAVLPATAFIRVCRSRPGLSANFTKYLECVEAAQFRGGGARAVFDAVSEFLFGHAWVERKFEKFANLGAKPA